MPAHGIAIIYTSYTSRRFHIFMRRTAILHFSFLISHSIEALKRDQRAARPMDYPLILNLFIIFYLTRPELPFIINKLFNSDSGIL